MANFTPGPWHTRGKFIVATRNGHEGEIVVAPTFWLEHAPEETEANARLVAAAPDLLDAVRTFKAWLDHDNSSPDYGEFTRDTHPRGEEIWQQWWDRGLNLCADAQDKARAAIAKAEPTK